MRDNNRILFPVWAQWEQLLGQIWIGLAWNHIEFLKEVKLYLELVVIESKASTVLLVVPAQRFIQDPYATTFGGFSKVTNFFKAALRPPDSPTYSRVSQDPGLPPQADDEPGFELITCVSEGKRKESQRL